MPEIMISGSDSKLEARYTQGKEQNAPAALILHPHPLYGGTMNNKVVYNLYSQFASKGFSVLRFNFRGVGRSTGTFDNGVGELIDAAVALDWLQLQNPSAKSFWVAGFSFGSWIAMQLLMRRPEIQGFISVAPPANKYDFSFFSPCPCSGLFVQGDADSISTEESVAKLVGKIGKQKNIETQYAVIPGADHYFRTTMDEFIKTVSEYIDFRLSEIQESSQKVDKRRKKAQVITDLED